MVKPLHVHEGSKYVLLREEGMYKVKWVDVTE
jgi:hypothetical protein